MKKVAWVSLVLFLFMLSCSAAPVFWDRYDWTKDPKWSGYREMSQEEFQSWLAKYCLENPEKCKNRTWSNLIIVKAEAEGSGI